MTPLGDPVLFRPVGLRHGYHALLAAAGVDGLFEAGEQWAGSGWAIDAHQHDSWELYLQVAGEPTAWRVADRPLRVGPRQLLLVPPGTDHELLDPRPARWHFRFLSLDPTVLLVDHPRVAGVWAGRMPVLIPDAAAVEPVLAGFLGHVTTSSPLRADALRAAAVLVLITIADLAVGGVGHRSQAATHPAVARAVAQLRARYAEPLTVADLAAEVGLSTAHFAGLFTQAMGVTPATFRRDVRLDQASRMLTETTLTVAEISHSVGFSSAQHLATVMRSARQVSPSELRRRGVGG